MKNILLNVSTFCKTYKKRIITITASAILAVLIIGGIVGGILYSHVGSNNKYGQEQLQEIALARIPGEVVEVKKELNFENQSYQYEFKIKVQDNTLQEIKLDSKYGAILGVNDKNHKKESKNGKDMEDNKDRKH